MNAKELQARLKPWMMPIAIVLGFLFYREISMVEFLVPYLIFAMLFLTFSKIEPRHLRFSRNMWVLLAIQMLGGVGVYFAIAPFNVTVAQAVMICVLCPVATAASVVTGMLGGDIGKVAAFSVLSNLAVALATPVLLAFIAPDTADGFLACFKGIALKVTPLLVFPLLLAFALRAWLPQVHQKVAESSHLAFYIWTTSLIIVVGRSVGFVMAEPRSYWPVMGIMAAAAACVCAVLYAVGKRVGRASGESITTGQSLGQKNTVLAIWIAMTYLNGVSSVGPAAYVIWQNGFNSWQLYRKMKREAKTAKEWP